MAVQIEAKKKLPVRDSSYPSIRDIFVHEGRTGPLYNDADYATWTNPTGGGTTNISAINMPYNKAVWIDRIYFSCSHAVRFDVVVNYVSDPAGGSQPYMIYHGRCPAGGEVKHEVGMYLLGSVGTQVLFRIYKVETATEPVAVHFTWGLDNFVLFEDVNFFSEGTIMWMGDSISNGGGPTLKSSFYPARIGKYIEDQGYNRRLSIRAYNGCTSGYIETLAASGFYKWPNVTSVFYALGTNDANQAVSPDSYKSNVKAMIKRIKKTYGSKVPIYILPPPPLANNGSEANAVALRQKAREAVSEANWGVSDKFTYDKDCQAFFIDVSGAFNRTLGSNYLENQPQEGVHPSNAGSIAIADTIIAAFQAIESQVGGNFKLSF